MCQNSILHPQHPWFPNCRRKEEESVGGRGGHECPSGLWQSHYARYYAYLTGILCATMLHPYPGGTHWSWQERCQVSLDLSPGTRIPTYWCVKEEHLCKHHIGSRDMVKALTSHTANWYHIGSPEHHQERALSIEPRVSHKHWQMRPKGKEY